MEKKSGKATLERTFLRLSTQRDREVIKTVIGISINAIVQISTIYQSMMRRSLPKYLFVAGGALLTLFGIYLARFFW